MCNWFQNKSPTHTFAVDWDTWHGNWAAPCYFNGASPTGSARWGYCLQRHLACEGLYFIRVTFVTRMKSFTEHFIRVWIHTSKISKVSRNISYVYEFIRRRFHTRIKSNAFEKIRVCKIPWMILHNDTRIKSYTYEKLHVWTVTRMKNYTYEKLHVLNIEFWLVHCYTRIDSFTELLIRVCFLTWNFSYVEPLPLFVHFGQP